MNEKILELAAELEQSALATHRSLEIATMLLQLQAENESLKNDVAYLRWIKEKE